MQCEMEGVRMEGYEKMKGYENSYSYYVFHGRVTLFFANNFLTQRRITMKFLHNFF